MASEWWTTYVVGRKGEVYDLGKREFPPTELIPLFGSTARQSFVDNLKTMTSNEVLKYFK